MAAVAAPVPQESLPSVPRRGVQSLLSLSALLLASPDRGMPDKGHVAHNEDMAISLHLACSMPYAESVATRHAVPAATSEVVRRVAEARGWDERAAARVINTLLRLLHAVEPK